MSKKAIGIDIGGTGIKGAVVDTAKGNLIGDRIRYETPVGGKPDDIARVTRKIVDELTPGRAKLPVGICFPAVVKNGVTMSAANISKDWIGFNADAFFTRELRHEVSVINDADAAGQAEMKFGAGRGRKGLVIMTTLGTGIGTALFINGKLVPNTELGHLEIEGVDYESQASFAAKERENLSFSDWSMRLQKYYSTLERLFSPDLFMVGGGISKQHDQFLPLLQLRTEIVPAQKKNNAGILGAAELANEKAQK
jgi:polyphosphate glucokinase